MNRQTDRQASRQAGRQTQTANPGWGSLVSWSVDPCTETLVVGSVSGQGTCNSWLWYYTYFRIDGPQNH